MRPDEYSLTVKEYFQSLTRPLHDFSALLECSINEEPHNAQAGRVVTALASLMQIKLEEFAEELEAENGEVLVVLDRYEQDYTTRPRLEKNFLEVGAFRGNRADASCVCKCAQKVKNA